MKIAVETRKKILTSQWKCTNSLSTYVQICKNSIIKKFLVLGHYSKDVPKQQFLNIITYNKFTKKFYYPAGWIHNECIFKIEGQFL